MHIGTPRQFAVLSARELDRVRRIAPALPGVNERTRHGGRVSSFVTSSLSAFPLPFPVATGRVHSAEELLVCEPDAQLADLIDAEFVIQTLDQL